MAKTMKTKYGNYIVPDIGIVEWSDTSGNDSVPRIEAGEIYILNYKGKSPKDTKEIRPFMPFLNSYISNRSSQPIRAQIGDQRRSGFTIDAKRGRSISEIPFTELTIFNEGNAAIEAGEIVIVCSNDLSAILKYSEAVERNLIDPIIFRV